MNIDTILHFEGAAWAVRSKVGDLVVCRRADVEGEITRPQDLVTLKFSQSADGVFTFKRVG